MGQKCCYCCCTKPPPLPDSREVMYEVVEEVQVPKIPEVVDFVVALHSYRANGVYELSFDRGDTLEVLNKDDEDWWLAKYPSQSHIGYIPTPYVALSSSLESHEWYHGEMTRVEAEQLLMSRLNTVGAFLMRMSHHTNSYVLSVQTLASDGYTPRVKHFNITKTNDDRYMFARRCFSTLSDLVEHFIFAVDVGLPQGMSKYPCVRPPPTMQDISRETKDQWEIPRDQLSSVKRIGQGSFGEVWLGKCNGVDVAIKMMKEGKMSAEDFLEEAKVMKQLRHPNVLALYAVCTREEPLLIVTEYMPRGALLDLLRKEQMNLELQLYIASQAAAGMEYLEREQLVHRDLAARNILVGECYVCKVADFGLTKIYADLVNPMTSSGRLPIRWMAPEALLYQKYSSKSDVWSFAVMVIEILTHGGIPYPGIRNADVLNKVCSGYRIPHPERCPPMLYDLLLKCWSDNTHDRPTFHFIHDYLLNFDAQSESSYCTNSVL